MKFSDRVVIQKVDVDDNVLNEAIFDLEYIYPSAFGHWAVSISMGGEQILFVTWGDARFNANSLTVLASNVYNNCVDIAYSMFEDGE